ncbi:hypothetical protein GHT06_008667 [Daphnia sinensis]|uniref:Uncharacterized protein n=1 Tax=Daphnia sinensis TaxID=1820382 RepID=A0AAD5LLI8_9CRUS|nr:hypothetical protein GHT06_008667 [Daphnia sinensis]
MPSNTSFPSPRPLPGLKKTFPDVAARVNSFGERKSATKLPVTSVSAVPEKPGNVSRKTDSAADNQKCSPSANVSRTQKLRPHHDSFAASACLRTAAAAKTQKVEVKSTPPVQKPDFTTSCTVGQTASLKSKLFAFKPLPGKKKTLEDFVRKPFRATPVPLSTYTLPKDCPTGKQGTQKPAKKVTVTTPSPDPVKPVPFRARPVPASTYSPSIQPTVCKIRKIKIEKPDKSAVIVDKPAVDNDVNISEPIPETASCEPAMEESGSNETEAEAAAV